MSIDKRTLEHAMSFTEDAEAAWMHETCLHRTLNERLIEDGEEPITIDRLRCYMMQRGYRYYIDSKGNLIWEGIGWYVCSEHSGDWASCDSEYDVVG